MEVVGRMTDTRNDFLPVFHDFFKVLLLISLPHTHAASPCKQEQMLQQAEFTL